MFDAETKYAALVRELEELKRRVSALERKQRGPVASSTPNPDDPLPTGPGEGGGGTHP